MTNFVQFFKVSSLSAYMKDRKKNERLDSSRSSVCLSGLCLEHLLDSSFRMYHGSEFLIVLQLDVSARSHALL